MSLLNKVNIFELFKIIDYYHAVFIGENIGIDYLTDEDKAVLKQYGIDINKFSKKTILDYAFHFGVVSSALKQKDVDKMSFKEFKRFMASGNYLGLTKDENLALKAVKQMIFGDIKGLGNRIKQQVNQIVINIDTKQAAKVKKQIEKEVYDAVLNRKSIQQLSSELGEKTKDWARDFDRISDYMMHSAFQRGRTADLFGRYGDDVEVYFTVYEGACPHCIRTYLTDGIGSEPKVFKLIDVVANGNNIGRKAIDYLPSVDPLHPWCRCTLTLKPENGKWDNSKQQFVITRNTYGVKRKSKIRIS